MAWNNDTLVDLLKTGAFEVGTDNQGQIIIYTNLWDKDGELVSGDINDEDSCHNNMGEHLSAIADSQFYQGMVI